MKNYLGEHPMIKKNLMGLAIAAAFFSTAGISQAQGPKTGENAAPSGYRIGPEDILQISVFGNEALSRIVPVRPDGKISLPLLNDVQAAGLTPMELRDSLMKKLVEFVPSPEIAVIVTEVRSLMISVIGEVMKPGRYDLKNAATIIDALAMAGGLKEFAARSRIVVIRNEGSAQKRLSFDYDKMSAPKNPQDNFTLRAGDIVMVP
jgi:polysaccharide biosynthesis/export protein